MDNCHQLLCIIECHTSNIIIYENSHIQVNNTELMIRSIKICHYILFLFTVLSLNLIKLKSKIFVSAFPEFCLILIYHIAYCRFIYFQFSYLFYHFRRPDTQECLRHPWFKVWISDIHLAILSKVPFLIYLF